METFTALSLVPEATAVQFGDLGWLVSMVPEAAH